MQLKQERNSQKYLRNIKDYMLLISRKNKRNLEQQLFFPYTN